MTEGTTYDLQTRTMTRSGSVLPLPSGAAWSAPASPSEVGGQVFEMAEHEVMVRGRGWVKSRRDLELVPLRANERGVPVRIADIDSIGPISVIRRIEG